MHHCDNRSKAADLYLWKEHLIASQYRSPILCHISLLELAAGNQYSPSLFDWTGHWITMNKILPWPCGIEFVYKVVWVSSIIMERVCSRGIVGSRHIVNTDVASFLKCKRSPFIFYDLTWPNEWTGIIQFVYMFTSHYTSAGCQKLKNRSIWNHAPNI